MTFHDRTPSVSPSQNTEPCPPGSGSLCPPDRRRPLHSGRDTKRVALWIASLILSLLSLPGVADEVDLARRQADQRQARTMVRELVSTVLDLQLRQLEENGLTELPLYRDIWTMRGNLSDLVESEMATVVEQLAAVDRASGTDREAKLVEARRSIREIVVRLSVERQSLMRRLKSAEIAEQARRLIALQTVARESTAEMPTLSSDRRPAATLKTLEDQRDVNGLYDQLVTMLTDVATWDGPVATAASEGLRALKDAEAARRLDQCEQTLANADFEAAVAHQDAVLAGLRKLLGAIEQAQGAVDSGSNRLAETVAALREQQQELLNTVQQNGLKTPPEPAMVEAQQAISQALSELSDELANTPQAVLLRAQAEAAARAATEAMFMSEEDATLQEQQRTVDRLTSLEQVLREASSNEHQDRSASQLAEAVDDLRQARDELQIAAATHEQAAQARRDNPQDAAAKEKTAADQTAAIEAGKTLPPDVKARLADAADAARTAAEVLQSGKNDSPENAAKAEHAVDEAGDAIQRAQAAIEETLADTQRAESAVRIGELARAAEVIERAAAAERELAAKASRDGELDVQTAAEMQQVQSDVSAVVAKTAEGVKAAAPTAAETLAKALVSSKQVEDSLAKAQAGEGHQPSENAPAKPDEPARETDTPRAPVAAQANETATLLTNAAAELRREIGTTANALADTVDRQLEPVGTAQQAIQSARAALPSEPEPAIRAAEAAAQAAARAEVGATTATQAARDALRRNGDRTDASDALDRAAIGLAAREMDLRRDQQLARQLAQLAEHQQTASDTIATTRQSLAEAPTDPEAMTPDQREHAKALHAATRQFSAAQRATGQGAAMVSDQQQIMNTPLREALQAAERLPVPQLPGEPVDEQVAQANEANAEAQPSENTEQGEGPSSQQGEGQNPANAPSPETASSGKPGQAASASSPNGMPQPTGLGTGLVPAAPDETARMMAGPDAQAALAAMAAAAAESMEDVAASETGLDGELPDGTPPPDSTTDSQTASAKGMQPADSGPADSDSQSLAPSSQDAAAGTSAPADAPWFAKLPPEVRAAIRASSSQPAPKGYEGRLKRYFESVE